MRVTQLRLAGAGVWPPLVIESFGPGVNVLYGGPRTGKSTVARFVGHLLYGKNDGGWRVEAGPPIPLVEGSLEVQTPRGNYTLRRHRDGSALGRLSIAGSQGIACDGRTIRELLCDRSPRLLGELYAVDFAAQPAVRVLLGGDFAREFTHAIAATPAKSGEVVTPISTPRIEDLICRRDEIVSRIESHMGALRRTSSGLDRELAEVEQLLVAARRRREDLLAQLRGVEAELADATARLRHLGLTSTIRTPVAGEVRDAELERLEIEVGRCRQMLADLEQRAATVRRELAEVHPDGTADGAAALADQRATLRVLERLADELDAEVAQLAQAQQSGRGVTHDAHARFSPVAQMMREQIYTLCGQTTEQERAARRRQLHAESRQLARAQSDLSEQLEFLLDRRQSIVHAAQIAGRPAAMAPQPPAAAHCHCERHGEYVGRGKPLMTIPLGLDEDSVRRRRTDLEAARDRFRAERDATDRDIVELEGRRQQLQLDRAGVPGREALDALRAELADIELQIARPRVESPALSSPNGVAWRASDALAQLTGGELVQIRASRETNDATIVDRAGRTLRIEELTAAQQDQAYLSLALALVSSLGQRGVELPLVLDEPFLRQDAAASARMAGVLEEFCRPGRQVLVLTENREATRRFESLGVEVRDLDLLRRGATGVAASWEAKVVAPDVAVAAPPKPAAEPVEIRVIRETVGQSRPQLRVAGAWPADHETESYYLAADASLGDFPVLGNDTARIFSALGIRTVQQLLAADADDVAEKLDRPAIGADAVRLWQSHMSLMCFVPGVSLADAQVLAANEINSPEALFSVDVRLLSEAIERFLETDRGRRFATAGPRFSRDRLAKLQKLARKNRDRWQAASEKFGWLERTTVSPRPRRSSTAVAGDRRQTPKRRKAALAAPTPLRAEQLVFHLQRTSSVVDAPSIGPRLAERLASVGIRTVADLLNANPESTADELADSRITAATVAQWQKESRLLCRVPGLRAGAAQVLVACGYVEPEQIAAAQVDELSAKVRAFCRTATGKRLRRNGAAPTKTRIAQWIRLASHRRPLEAA